ncbi:synaptotagmin-3 isoform X1 [Beta vulgaris subsp. vulgaris]|uniref:synaptotagmin-3 isoform X1 n=2 Tax=Beta vulgaris subsp. vulgaris TaxID=3555 RepID=UPI0020370CAA|nr:synaptotagmin-3 isoform X1 [Beta vulgaris subsp. vulgaris]
MGFLSTFVGILGFGIGLPMGLVVGFFFFIYSKPKEVEEPDITPLQDLDTDTLLGILPDIPNWVKSPDYERVDWLNKFVLEMWPYLDKAICNTIRSMAKPIFADYIGKYQIKDIDFENLSLGTLPPIFYGMKAYEMNDRQLVMEPAIRWAGNPNIVLAVKLMSTKIRIQLVDVQIFADPRIHLKPLVPTFPCFANVVVSLMEKPHVDFGLKVLGGDIMSVPGLYRFVQETIKKQVASLYHWPQSLEIPILDTSTAAIQKPVGILHVKVVRAVKLLKMDILGTSDPYVKLKLSGVTRPTKKTTIKMRNLNPEWNEDFKLIVKDPETQVLELQVYDWDKFGGHDNLGMQIVPLKQLTPHEPKLFTLDLLKSFDMKDTHDGKSRGQLMVELTFDPFKLESDSFKGPEDEPMMRKQSSMEKAIDDASVSCEGGALLVSVISAKEVEGEHHTNPYAQILFRGEKKKTKTIKNTRRPRWDEQFSYMLDEPPLHEKMRIEILSKRRSFGFMRKESLGFLDITLADVVNNERINDRYNLINSKNGSIHVALEWQTI